MKQTLGDRIMREQLAPPQNERMNMFIEVVSGVTCLLAMVVSAVLLGVCLVWIVSGGPDGVVVPVRVMWTRGSGLGFAMLAAGAVGYVWGTCGRRR